MKIKCDFCKTEYSVDNVPSTPVKCAVCGHSWSVAMPSRKNTWLMFFAALCALLSAIIFAVAVITHHKARQSSHGPLIANVTALETTTNDAGEKQVVVNGTVTNISDAIYGVPDLVLVSHGADDTIIEKQKFMPSATLLDSGSYTEFRHILSVPVSAVKKITVELPNLPTSGGKK